MMGTEIDKSKNSYKMVRALFLIYITLIIFALFIELLVLFNKIQPASLFYIIQFINVILILIFYSKWLYHFHKDIRSFDNTYPISQGQALAQFWIPIYNIWGIWNFHNTYAQRLINHYSSLQREGNILKSLLPFFYGLFILSRIIGRVFLKIELSSDIEQILSPISSIIDIALFMTWLRMITLMQNSFNTLTRTNDISSLKIEEPEKTWECPECKHKNPNTIYICNNCKYRLV